MSIRVYNVHICAGTLISPKHVLTLAYCCYDPKTLCLINHEDYSVVASDRIDNPCRTRVNKVQEVAIHENFSYSQLKNNIAVLKVSRYLLLFQFETKN